MEIGLLLLRLVVGGTIAAHGAQKLFGWFGGHGPEATGRALESLGFFPGRRQAVMAGIVEIAGGLSLALGLLTPVGATLVASVMVVAAASAHFRNGFFAMGGGYEYNLVLGVTALALAFTGPGALSLDALLGYSSSGVAWGIGAFVVGVLGAAVQLAQRRVPAAEKEGGQEMHAQEA